MNYFITFKKQDAECILSLSDIDMEQEQSKPEGNALTFECKAKPKRCRKNLQLDFIEYAV